MTATTKRLTKREREEKERQAREHEARIFAALCWTDEAPGPDVPPPVGSGNQLTTGYVYNEYAESVAEACSSSYNHAIGRTDRTTSQRPISLFSTRERALRALRNALERRAAEMLARIDGQIEQARREDS